MKTIADHKDYRITMHQWDAAPAKLCLITFGCQPSDLADEGFGTEFARKNGWDNIYVAQRHGTQYQGLSLEAFRDAVAPVVMDRTPVCYGPSLGGYAAFYYGGSVDARIIGGAPMFPAWPKFGNRAYAQLPITHRDLAQVPRSKHSPVAIYDPFMPRDVAMIEQMIAPAYPDLRRLTYQGAGHTVLITLQQSGQLKSVITALIERDEILPIQPLQEGSAVYHRTRGRLLQVSDPDGAQRELERSLMLEPSRQTLAILLSLFLRHNRLSEAQELIDKAEASGDRRMTIIPGIKEALKAAGLRVRESLT